jgi:diguanylate cyclase (GGDEF)-like protein
MIRLLTVSGSSEQMKTLLNLIQQMTARSMQSATASDLVDSSLKTMFETVPFDLGAAVLVEQNLDLHIASRRGIAVEERLVARIRLLMQSDVPGAPPDADVVVRSEMTAFPARPAASTSGEPRQAWAVLKRSNQPAGLVIVERIEPFAADEARMVEIFAAQLSILLDNLSARTKITSLLETDDLTGVPNRRHFKKQLASEIDRARVYNLPLSIMIIDLDEFRRINDTFGIVTGDVLLSELCGAIRESLRPADAVARYGDDEFTVTLPHTDLPGAAAVADRILSRVRAFRIPVDGEKSIGCTVSIGIVQMQGEDASAREMIQRADDRLFDAKRQGKNRSAF